jgi:hypothetical protein
MDITNKKIEVQFNIHKEPNELTSDGALQHQQKLLKRWNLKTLGFQVQSV